MRAALLLAPLLLGTACDADVNVLAPARASSSVPMKDSGPPPQEAASPEGSAPVPEGDVVTVVAAFSDTCAVRSGALYCWGTSPDGRARALPERVESTGVGAFQSVSAGLRAHCAVRAGGTVWCFGVSDQGQLAQGDTTPRKAATRVTLPFAAKDVRGRFGTFCAVVEGRLFCWGDNEEGQIAQDDPFPGPGADAVLPLAVGDGADWRVAEAGQGHACGLRGDGELHCWGRNSDGELGLGPGSGGQLRSTQRVGTGANWTSVVVGQNTTCAIERPGALFCWGGGSQGYLGESAVVDVPTRVGTDDDWLSVSIDTFHVCGIRRPGLLYCWGRNVEGQLATGDVEDRQGPVHVGAESDWTDVTVGRFHTCGRRANGKAYCAGENDDGRLGTGDFERRNTMTEVVWSVAR